MVKCDIVQVYNLTKWEPCLNYGIWHEWYMNGLNVQLELSMVYDIYLYIYGMNENGKREERVPMKEQRKRKSFILVFEIPQNF